MTETITTLRQFPKTNTVVEEQTVVSEGSYILPKRKTNIGLIIGSIVASGLLIGGIIYIVRIKKQLEESRTELDSRAITIQELRTTLSNCQRECLSPDCPPCETLPTITPPRTPEPTLPRTPEPTLPRTPEPTLPRTPSPPSTPINDEPITPTPTTPGRDRNVIQRRSRFRLDVATGVVSRCIITIYRDGRVDEKCTRVGKIELTGFETDEELRDKLDTFSRTLK